MGQGKRIVRALVCALVACACSAGPAAASLPGPNGRIAFVSDRTGSPGLWVMKANGTEQRQLLADFGKLRDPAWSPGGDMLAFAADKGGGFDIYVAGFVDTSSGVVHLSTPIRITTQPDNEIAPAWSPDASKIAFETDRDLGLHQIYLMQPDGRDQKRLTNGQTYEEFKPTWSPSGTRLAYSQLCVLSNCSVGADYEIATISPTGTTKLLATSNNINDGDLGSGPDWSPDGGSMVYYGFNGTCTCLWDLNLSNGLVRGVAAYADKADRAAYAPANNAVVYGRFGEIYYVAKGSLGFSASPTNLSNNSARDWSPAWQRSSTPLPIGIEGDSLQLSINSTTRRFTFKSKDVAIDTESSADPSKQGAGLRLRGAGGLSEDAVMPVAGWKKFGRPGDLTYFYSDSDARFGPVRKATLRNGSLSVTGKSKLAAPSFGFALATSPGPVSVAVRIGAMPNKTYCANFGGDVNYARLPTGQALFRAYDSPVPTSFTSCL